MAEPMEIRVYQAPSVRWGAKVMLELPVAESGRLYGWLLKVPTHTMSDEEYTELVAMRVKLLEAIKNG